jgi:hypothetical protein
MVALQCLVVVGLVTSTGEPACASSDQCPQAGTYCAIGVDNRCNYCGESAPLPPQTEPATGGVLNDALAPDFAGFNITAVAELCADPSLTQYTGDYWKMEIEWTTSSLVSWCKSDREALDLFKSRLFLIVQL